nr:glycerol-3-phosphate acyltransferase [Shouchella shacheensis]
MRPLFDVGLLFISYWFGCVNGAYYVGRQVGKQDVRELGSTNAGARNAGRVFGKRAFVQKRIDSIERDLESMRKQKCTETTSASLYDLARCYCRANVKYRKAMRTSGSSFFSNPFNCSRGCC